MRPISKDIAVFKDFDEIVNKDNYLEYELTKDIINKTDRNLWKWKTIVLAEMEYVTEVIEGDATTEWYEMNMEC